MTPALTFSTTLTLVVAAFFVMVGGFAFVGNAPNLVGFCMSLARSSSILEEGPVFKPDKRRGFSSPVKPCGPEWCAASGLLREVV